MAVATRDGEGKPGAQRASKGEERASSRPRKALTIGAVCKILGQEFEDISISKIRYLEDQKLLSPRRTPGGRSSSGPNPSAAPELREDGALNGMRDTQLESE